MGYTRIDVWVPHSFNKIFQQNAPQLYLMRPYSIIFNESL